MYQIKPTLSISSLITKISTKYHVKITDKYKAQSYLRHINYYRLSEYLVKLSVTEPGIDFEKVLKYYDFDRKLKFLALDGIERIEVSFRAMLLMEPVLCTKDELWYTNKNHYENADAFESTCSLYISYVNGFKNISLQNYLKSQYDTFDKKIWMDTAKILEFFLPKLNKYLKDKKEAIRHKCGLPELPVVEYKDMLSKGVNISTLKYLISEINNLSGIRAWLGAGVTSFFINKQSLNIVDLLSYVLFALKIPFYIIVESLTMGQISTLYPRLHPSIRQTIANNFKLNLSEKAVKQHLRALTGMRNIIAHHDRLFNNSKLIKISNFDKLTCFNSSSPRAYFDLIEYYLTLIAPEHTFKKKLNDQIDKYVSKYKICLNHWGFIYT